MKEKTSHTPGTLFIFLGFLFLFFFSYKIIKIKGFAERTKN